MSTRNSLQKIRTFNQDVRRLQGIETTETKSEPEKNESKIVLRSPKQTEVKTNQSVKPDHEIFVSPRVEPMSDLPKLLSDQKDSISENKDTDATDPQTETITDKPKKEPALKITSDKNKSDNKNNGVKLSVPNEHADSIKAAKAKLQDHREKAEATIAETAHTVSSHPESIQESGKRDVFEVGEGDTTSATIVRDKKIRKNNVLSDTISSLKNWFLKFKNTYITPPKPTYTVGKAERRAGVLQSATSQTGASLVDHDTFAERIREKYKDSYQETIHTTDQEMDPAWLPALPSDEKTDNISEVTTVPRKRASSTNNEEADKNTTGWETASKTPEPKEEMQSKVEEAVSSIKESKPVVTKDNETFTVPSASEADIVQKNLQTQTKDQETTSAKKAEPLQETPSQPAPRLTKEEGESETDSISPAIPTPPKPEETSDGKDESLPDTASDLVNKTAEELQTKNKPETTDDTEAVKETEKGADSEAKTNLLPPNYTGVEDKAPEPNTLTNEQTRINMLSVSVVVGIVFILLVGLVGFPFISSLFSEKITSEITLPNYIGSQTIAIDLNSAESIERRYAMLNEQMQNNNTTVQITPVNNLESKQMLSARNTMELLNITTPGSVYSITQELHFGSSADNIPFLLIRISDTKQALGAMLQWEPNLAEELQNLLGYTDRSGSFVDQTISDMDIRTLKRADDTSIVTYLIMDTMIIITTTPNTLENLLPSLK